MGRYNNGSLVRLLEYYGGQDGKYNYCLVQTMDGKTGYMMAKYLTVSENTTSGTATVYNPNGNSYVNFRSGASLNASVIRLQNAAHDAQQCRLACSVGTDERDHTAAGDGKRDIIHRAHHLTGGTPGIAHRKMHTHML